MSSRFLEIHLRMRGMKSAMRIAPQAIEAARVEAVVLDRPSPWDSQRRKGIAMKYKAAIMKDQETRAK